MSRVRVKFVRYLDTFKHYTFNAWWARCSPALSISHSDLMCVWSLAVSTSQPSCWWFEVLLENPSFFHPFLANQQCSHRQQNSTRAWCYSVPLNLCDLQLWSLILNFYFGAGAMVIQSSWTMDYSMDISFLPMAGLSLYGSSVVPHHCKLFSLSWQVGYNLY